MPSPCEQIKAEYEDLKTLKGEFDSEFAKALETGDLARAKELKAELERKRAALEEKLWPFENLPQKELKRQYEEKKEILQRIGLLEVFSSGELGIKGIDNREYAIPSFREITRILRENKEKFAEKMKQGFTEMEIVPFGLPLEKLIKTAGETILKHHKEGKLFATKENPEDENEKLELLSLDENQPFYHWEGYDNADTDGELVYFPESFSQNHQGKTKKEILKETNQGFQVILREKNINIPRRGEEKIIGGRAQIDTAGTSIEKYIKKGANIPIPEEYLKAIQTEEQYKNEEGQTPEDWLAIFLAHLEKRNQVIDDYRGNGSIAYNLGAYFPAGGGVPHAHWSRDLRQAGLSRDFPSLRSGNSGARGRVRVI